jgi:pumilio family protein 6
LSLLNISEPGEEPNKRTNKATPKDNDNTKLSDLIPNHSFSRIFQTLLKYSSPSQRELIAQHLEGSYKQLAESRYSRFLVCKILKLASVERRRKIMGEFEGNVVRMVRHAEAGKVLADAFEVWAGEWERAVLVREFFGKEVIMFGLGGGGFGCKGGSEEERVKAKRGLKGLLEDLDLEKRKRILGSTKENLLTMYDARFLVIPITDILTMTR